MDDIESSSIDFIVEGFRQKFGDEAAEVALRQVMQAAPDTLGVWLNIASRLSGQPASATARAGLLSSRQRS